MQRQPRGGSSGSRPLIRWARRQVSAFAWSRHRVLLSQLRRRGRPRCPLAEKRERAGSETCQIRLRDHRATTPGLLALTLAGATVALAIGVRLGTVGRRAMAGATLLGSSCRARCQARIGHGLHAHHRAEAIDRLPRECRSHPGSSVARASTSMGGASPFAESVARTNDRSSIVPKYCATVAA